MAKLLPNTSQNFKWLILIKRQDDFTLTNISPMKEQWSLEILLLFKLGGGISHPNV